MPEDRVEHAISLRGLDLAFAFPLTNLHNTLRNAHKAQPRPQNCRRCLGGLPSPDFRCRWRRLSRNDAAVARHSKVDYLFAKKTW
jgi:hypothetical protein